MQFALAGANGAVCACRNFFAMLQLSKGAIHFEKDSVVGVKKLRCLERCLIHFQVCSALGLRYPWRRIH